MTNQKARYWLLTIPQHEFIPYQPLGITWIRGQLELGSTTGYLHWQLFVAFDKQHRLAGVRRIFGTNCHAEPSRSTAAEDYVFKQDTAVEGTRFELGSKPLNRNSSKDWAAIKDSAKRGALDDIPADVYCRNYHTLKRIATDHLQPVGIERTVKVFWGPTGTGKSRRAWDEAGIDAYPKNPNTKFWDGYAGHRHVVIDEFRGKIDISNMLLWLDRYPTIVEVKGGATVFKAEKIWITSNLHPSDWYPELDNSTKEALYRRLIIEEIK